ncbi:hypothetical protein HDU88_001918 [Geranomyces variabilis]|nr:hypothetical protein HDU88_001918 [Geranomyces variabilis]
MCSKARREKDWYIWQGMCCWRYAAFLRTEPGAGSLKRSIVAQLVAKYCSAKALRATEQAYYQATTDERARSVWSELRAYAGLFAQSVKDGLYVALDQAQRSINTARRAKVYLQADPDSFETMAMAVMDTIAAVRIAPDFLVALCQDVNAILLSDPIRRTLLVEGHLLASLPAAFVARVVKICLSDGVLCAMEQAYRGNRLDVAGLPVAERSDKSPVMYLHADTAKAFDGPNVLPPDAMLHLNTPAQQQKVPVLPSFPRRYAPYIACNLLSGLCHGKPSYYR